MHKQRLKWVDIAKGIGIVLVIAGHTLPSASTVRGLIFSCHMPLFFVLAGYTFRTKSAKEQISSSLRTLMLPYCLVLFLRTFVKWARDGVVTSDAMRSLARSVFYSSGVEVHGAQPVGLVWFFMVLLLARILINSIETLFEHRRVSLPLRAVFWLFVGATGVVLGLCHVYLPLSFDLVLVACLFIEAGMVSRQLNITEKLDDWRFLAVTCGIWLLCAATSDLELAARVYRTPVLAILGGLMGSLVVMSVAKHLERYHVAQSVLGWTGENSLLILCIHALDRFVTWLPFALTSPLPAAAYLVCLVRITVDVAVSRALWGMANRNAPRTAKDL